MQEHYMSLTKVPFEQIQKGEKSVEIRLYDEKRRLVQVGDIIYFSLVDDEKQVIKTKVLALHRFASFAQLFSTNLLSKGGFSGYTIEESIACMREFYAREKEEKYGVLGIEIMIEE